MRRTKSKNIPIAYRAGVCYFCEMPFFVNKNVLIPRYDTELLAEKSVQLVPEFSNVLDLCTGSGCVGIILAKHGFRVTASDISKKALRTARKNADLNQVDVEYIKSDLFYNLGGRKFDAIVCNPPYIKTGEIGLYDKSIFYEPRSALDGGQDGLVFYRRIASGAGKYLNRNGVLLLEIGFNQADPVKTVLRQNGFANISIFKDLADNDRVISCNKNLREDTDR
jgi:release factor glutamine methyltransferase